MREDIREYLRQASTGNARREALFADVPEIEDDLGEAILDAQIAAAERLDPSQAASSLFLVRLSGPGVVDGWIEQGMQDEILGPLTKEVEYAAPSAARSDVRLGLVGVSSGSVLLHYRPLSPALPPSPKQLHYSTHPADSAVLRVLELHDFLERETDVHTIGSAFKEDQDVLRQARKLVEALEKHSVNLTTRWWGSTSVRRMSKITQRGRRHALRIFTAQEQDTPQQVQGMVTGLDISGIVTVAGASGNKKYKVDVGSERISDPEFTLGRRVFMLVRKIQDVDQVGVSQTHARFRFVRHLDQTPLDF
ncbi:hypothetical protein [Microbacterium sp. USTB-Y]|uniref:hypothetical protein n=1 Tax=Microbacterium sp. USTB-Y TaxID=2823692 RepID=UPI00203C1B37|nr:hypothetical protein [Microbacterium sp. USTB-Y]